MLEAATEEHRRHGLVPSLASLPPTLFPHSAIVYLFHAVFEYMMFEQLSQVKNRFVSPGLIGRKKGTPFKYSRITILRNAVKKSMALSSVERRSGHTAMRKSVGFHNG